MTERRFGDAARLGWSLLLTGTLFLSLAKSKLLTYALPVFPAIALLAAVAWLALDRTRSTALHPIASAGSRGCRRCRR